MNIMLSVDSYKGADGSSLTPTRCYQLVQVYEMLEEMGLKKITYVDIQEEAQMKKLFGEAQAKSAIRTIFPLLKKIGFVNYDGTFSANECFTKLGTQFVLACRIGNNLTDETPHKEEILALVQDIKEKTQQMGLIHMYNNQEWKTHNIWVALRLLKEFRVIHWNEFLYALHCFENGHTIEDAIREIKKDKTRIDATVFISESQDALPNTCYSYIRSYLEEAGLISKVSSLESKLLDDSDIFYSQIGL